jgi:hypothetical protein
VIGTGAYGGLPVMDEVKREAARREIELLILPTAEAVEALRQNSDNTNAILHGPAEKVLTAHLGGVRFAIGWKHTSSHLLQKKLSERS